MINVMFVCHGNICRSPMAEFVFRDMVCKRGLADSIHVVSSATSTEEIGNPVHPGTQKKLNGYGISSFGKCAIQLTKKDYDRYDYLIAMDRQNIRNMERIIGKDPDKKVCRLLDFTSNPRDIADPWYTQNFDMTYDEVVEGCEALMTFIMESGKLSGYSNC